MKRFSILALMMALGVVVSVGAPSAEANCIPGQSVGSYYYWIFADDSTDVNNFVGSFWQTGTKATMNQGTLPLNEWFFLIDPYYFTINGNLGDARVLGCNASLPSDTMTVFIENCVTDEGFIATAPRTSVGFDFDFGYATTGTYYNYPGTSSRPRVVSSSRTGTTIDVSFNVPNVSAIVVGDAPASDAAVYSIAVPNGQTPDTTSVDGWTLQSPVGATGGAGAAALDCADTGVDQWIATGVTIAGDVGLGCPVRVECDPTLANPGGPGPKGLKKIKRPRGNPQTDSAQ